MKKHKLTKEKVIELIKEEASVVKRKKEIYEEVKKINAELKELNENKGLAGTFGFVGDSGNASGFENPQNISYIAQLEKEFGIEKNEDEAINEDELNEISKLKDENEVLREKLKNIEETIKSAMG